MNSTRIVSRRGVSPQVLELTLTAGQVYRSRITQACLHLDELDRSYILQLEQQQGTQICAGDRFRVIDPLVARAGGAASFPVCRFGRFEPVPSPAR